MNTRTFARLSLSATSGLVAAAALILSSTTSAQPTSNSPLAPNPNGMRRTDPTWVALTNATVHPRPGETLARATVIFRDGRITDVLPADPGPDAKPNTDDDIAPRLPMGPRVYDYSGLHLYAAFVEPYLELDTPKPLASDPGKHWNDAVTPQRSALDGIATLEAQAANLRKLGFATAAISPKGGVFRGRSAVVSLAKANDDANAATDKPPVYLDGAYQSLSFDNDGSGYPSSQMGAIALIRQTFLDADWQAAARASVAFVEPWNCLDFLEYKQPARGSFSHRNVRVEFVRATPSDAPYSYVFDCSDELEILRACKIAEEFNRPITILGSGTEYKRLTAITHIGDQKPIASESMVGIDPEVDLPPLPTFLLPLNFPPSPDVSTLAKAEQAELRELMSWEQAPTNPRRLIEANIPFALTTHRLRNKSDFMGNLRRAIAHGLTEDQALAALTTKPAEILNLANELGQIAPGFRANLIISDGPIFAKKNAQDKAVKLRDLWIDGQRHELSPPPGPELEGSWKLELGGSGSPTLRVGPSSPAPLPSRKGLGEGSGLPSLTASISADNSITLTLNKKSTKAERVSVSNNTVAFTFDAAALDPSFNGTYALSGLLDRDATGQPTSFQGSGFDGQGNRLAFSAIKQPKNPILGTWRVTHADDAAKDPAGPDQLDLTITEDSLTLRFTFKDKDPLSIKADDFKLDGSTITFTHPLDKLGMEGKSSDTITLTGDTLEGVSTLPDNSKHTYKAALKDKKAKPDADDEPTDPALITKDIPQTLGLPFGPYALDAIPEQIDAVISHATVWTNTGEPIKDGHVAIKAGKIVFVGTEQQLGDWFQKGVKLKQPWVEIDGTGKHLTPGIIDAHSHTGISSGVNEGGRAVSPEVRIADVTNPDDLSWYRQLAGGVTTVLSLHGSANAIGGQSQTNKLRWGAVAPDDMHFEGAKPGIKFALGENPTWANSRGRDRTRYPVTRMGVETIIRDNFTQAKEYAIARKDPMKGGKVVSRNGTTTKRPVDSENPYLAPEHTDWTFVAPRRDLQLEALAEILAGERLVHCHSYRQDEILMLTQVARDFHFRIGTFQHILEGYKVADYVRDYSGGPSGFADWWAYKIEVQDAIPQGPVLMHEVGNTVSYNSDSDELARRLNVEAAKAIKYSDGRIKPTEALKFVTLNPAKQLMIDKQVGTIEVGKDADLALWSGDPLSAFSKCERTFVDGREMFSLEQDAKHREKIAAERSRIIQKLLTKPKKPKGDKDGDKADDDKPSDAPSESDRPRRRRPPTDDLTSGAPDGTSSADDAPEPGSSSDEVLRRRLLYLHLLSRGIDPESNYPGVCGCGFQH